MGLCLLCREGDWLGAALAYVSLMPAFHVFWRGALLYHERSWYQLEEFLGVGGNAGAQMPMEPCAWWHIAGSTARMTQWRSPDLLSCCYAVFSKLLKRLVKVERPAATCEALGLCGDLGERVKAASDD